LAELKYAHITVTVPDHIVIPPEAGNLSDAAVREIPKARRGLGAASEQAAACLENAGPTFVAPGITPEGLRSKGAMADDIDLVIVEVEGLLHKLKQANLLLDAAAWEDLRKLNDFVKAQGKHQPSVLTQFRPLTEFMSSRRTSVRSEQPEGE
jgi:hypothetical protein